MKICIVGPGVVGQSLARHFKLAQHHVSVIGHSAGASRAAAEALGVHAAETPEGADVVVLATKPQDLHTVAATLAASLGSQQLLVSTLAGVPLQTLKKLFPKPSLFRIMPNLPMAYGQGVIACVAEEGLPTDFQDRVQGLLDGLGLILWVPEKQFDAFTALSGSGPAFIYEIVQAFIDAGTSMGLDPSIARGAALQTMLGSVSMLCETGQDAERLVSEVSSKGGTTEAGLKVMKEKEIQAGIKATILAAYQRCQTMADRNS